MHALRNLLYLSLPIALAGCGVSTLSATKPAPRPTVRGLSETETVIARLEAKYAKMPGSARAACELATAYIQRGRETGELGNYTMGRDLLSKTRADHPDDRDTAVTLAWASTIFHDFETALGLATKLTNSDPKDADAWGVVSDCHLELGNYEEAVKAAQTMIDLRPNLASYSRGAQLRWILGDAKGAQYLTSLAIQAGGGTEAMSWARVQSGDMALKTGAYAAAEASYRKVLDSMPEYRHALAGMARVRLTQNRVEEAETLMLRATRTGPSVQMLDELAAIQSLRGEGAEAEATLARAETVQKEHMEIGIGGDEPALARVWLGSGVKKREALALMEAESKKHTSVPTYACLAWAYSANGRHREAVNAAKLALRTGVQEPWVLRRCAEVYRAAGEKDRAAKLERDARALCPSKALWELL
ncbi:MAG: tetratricopeptide repeat protein [Fimbriimonadaceae bacterium]|nr:tetratricopeptide repeat protein [Fimbriimonadaceae bacterium]